MVPAPSVKVPRVSTYSGSRCAFSLFPYGAFTLSGWLSQNHSGKIKGSRPRSEPQHARTLVWALSLSLAATQEIEFSFSSSGYLDVSVHRVPFHTLWIGVWIPGVCPGGFPHSEISGSMDICSSPKLIAAYHVFHRLLVPRHPPCALFCLASSDVIALTSDGLLVFFLSLLSQCLVFVSILRLTYHQEMNVLHMRFSRYSAQQNQNARRVLALRSVFLFCCIGCLLATEAASLPMCGLAHFSNKAVPCKSFYSVSTLSPYLID